MTLRQLPALKVVLFLAPGILIARWNNFSLPLLFTITALSLAISILLNRRSIGRWLLLLTLVSSGALIYLASLPPDDFPPTRIQLTGIVIEPPIVRGSSTYFPMRCCKPVDKSAQDARLHGKIWVTRNSTETQLKPGMMIGITGILRPNRPQRNPGDFNTKAWRERNGFIGALQSTEFDKLQIISNHQSPIYRARNQIIRITEQYGGQHAPLLRALLLGIRRDVDPDLVENLRMTGLSHLLALSGLHVGFLVAILIALGSIFRLSVAGRASLAVIGILLFLILVPPRSCTLRAAIMASAFLAGPILKRWSPPINSLAFAALVVLCLRPGDLFDAGFQLSFAAAGGIILYLPTRDRAKVFLGSVKSKSRRLLWLYVINPFLVSCAATLFVLPLTSYHFGMMAFGAPVFNIIAIPLLAFIFAGAWFTVGSSFVWSGLASLAADGVNGAILLFKWIVHLFSDFSPVWNGHLSPILILIVILSPVWLVISRRKYPAKLTIAFLLLLTVIAYQGFIPFPGRFQAWFLDVGNGDAQVWFFPDGRTAVIDGGSVGWGNRRNSVTAFLDHYDVKKVDILVASHPEADHIGGLIGVVDEFPVDLALASLKENNTLTYARLCSVSTARELSWHHVFTSDSIYGLHPDYHLTVLGPPPGAKSWSTNDASVVMKLQVPAGRGQSLRLLTTGDVEHLGEAALVRLGGLEAELLKLPHHGSKTSSSPEFIAAVKPRKTVVTRSGSWDAMKSPLSTEVIEQLKSEGVEVHHTGEEGGVLFEPGIKSGRAEWQRIDWRSSPFCRWFFGTI